MKKLFYLLLILISVCACNPTKTISNNPYDTDFYQTEITIDTISNEYFCNYMKHLNVTCDDSKWISVGYKDYETGEPIHKKMYI